MAYQRKKRAYEPEPQQVPQVQNDLFASPDVETEEVDTPYAVAGPTAAPNWDAVQRQIDNPLFDFGKISILPPDSALQRQPVDPSTLSKRERFIQRAFSVQREPVVSSMPGPPGPLDHHFAAPQREDGQAAPLAHPIAIQRQAETADQGIAQAGAVNLTPQGSGRPLPKQVTDPFVQSGYPEVQQARVHVDDTATQSIQAKAYTQNNNIVVQSSGANDPELLGHEATHVVQQSQMALKPDVNGTPINANPALEQNADDNGERVARNESVVVEGIRDPNTTKDTADRTELHPPIQRATGKPQNTPVIQRYLVDENNGNTTLDEKAADKFLANQKGLEITDEQIGFVVKALKTSQNKYTKKDLILAAKAVVLNREVGGFTPSLKETKNYHGKNKKDNLKKQKKSIYHSKHPFKSKGETIYLAKGTEYYDEKTSTWIKLTNNEYGKIHKKHPDQGYDDVELLTGKFKGTRLYVNTSEALVEPLIEEKKRIYLGKDTGVWINEKWSNLNEAVEVEVIEKDKKEKTVYLVHFLGGSYQGFELWVDTEKKPRNPVEYDYTHLKEPLFKNGAMPEAKDVKQGTLGDCFLQASIAAIAAQQPATLKKIFDEHKDGTVTINFKKFENQLVEINKWGDKGLKMVAVSDPVKVLKSVPINKKGLTKAYNNGKIWVDILQKAYIKYIQKNYKNSHAYASLTEGSPDTVFQAMLGVHGSIDQADGSDDTFNKIREALQDGKPVVAGTKEEITKSKDAIVYPTGEQVYGGLAGGHAYTVLGAKLIDAKLTVNSNWDKKADKSGKNPWLKMRNPWGKNAYAEPKGKKEKPLEGFIDLGNGEFYLNFRFFKEYFKTFNIGG